MVDQPNPGDIQPSFSTSFGGGWLLKTLRVFDNIYQGVTAVPSYYRYMYACGVALRGTRHARHALGWLHPCGPRPVRIAERVQYVPLDIWTSYKA